MTAKQIHKLCLDSCTILSGLQKHPDRVNDILAIEDEARNGGLILVVSTMAVAECLYLDKKTQDEHDLIDAWFENPYIEKVAVHQNVAAIARDIRRSVDVSGADSLHIATAIHAKCPVLLTYDGSKEKPKKKKLIPLSSKIPVAPSLQIMTPGALSEKQGKNGLPVFASFQQQLYPRP